MKKILFAISLAAAIAASAEWPTIKSAGFRNCALIYELKTRCAQDFKPMLAYNVWKTGDYENRWLFDSFLFLTQNVDGVRTEIGNTTMRHWTAMMDQWFAPGRDVPALNDALQELKRQIGAAPPHSIKVMFCIPWMSPEVKDFGDVDGDGVSEDLSKPEDARKVLAWYLVEIQRRLAPYPDLHLWGLYWMREDIGVDKPNISAAAEMLHRENLKLLWIPYFRAANWNRWKEFGFDVAIMQSNYAFTNYAMGGNSRRNRVDLCAKLAKAHDMGVEIEFPYGGDRCDLDVILQTFVAGTRLGFQSAPTAWFFSYRFDQYRSDRPEVREIYDRSADYITGDPVVVAAMDKWNINSGGDSLVADAKFKKPEFIDFIDVLLEESPDDFWRGLVTVECRDNPDEAWRQVAWSFRNGFAFANEDHQNITVEVHAAAREFRLSMVGASRPKLTGIFADFGGPRPRITGTFRRSYASDLPETPAPRPDNAAGNMLTDKTTSGGLEVFVGWHGRFDIQLDAPDKRYDELRVYAAYDPGMAIFWPDALQAVSAPRPLSGNAGFGAVPSDAHGFATFGPMIAAGGGFGYFPCRASGPVSDRYITVTGEAPGWAYLSEVALYFKGSPVDMSGVTYRLAVPPANWTPDDRDDGRKLTDGFESGEPGGGVRLPPGRSFVTVGLPDGCTFSKVTVAMAASAPGTAVTVIPGNGSPVEAVANGRCFMAEFPPAGPGSVTVQFNNEGKSATVTEIYAE
ncbi:MAG: DUF4855 domain-containing protein [Victivallaceae bacterium]|nr:DUF4855 domain-containing protein [Victivallaceae bacterium]